MLVERCESMSENNTILSRFFTQNSFSTFSPQSREDSPIYTVVRRYNISFDENSKNEDIISEIYQYVASNYRNEYFYKNTLLNKLLINAHRLRTTVALTEVPVAKSKADFIMINGKAVVYEIKTALDTFDRLDSQINDYFKAFDHVCVVTSEDKKEEAAKKLSGSPVGLYILTNRNTVQRYKEPEEYRDALSLSCIFKILNKQEYESIVRKLEGTLPSVTPINYYRKCKEIVCSSSIEKVYPLFLKELKKRNRIDVVDYKLIPDSLHFLTYFSKCKYSKECYDNLCLFLKQPFKGRDDYVLSSIEGSPE